MMLKKELNLLHVFSITLGAIMSSGLFILPGLAYAQAGPAVIAAYFLAGLLATTGMLSQAELASAMPKAGGTYFYVTRSMGPAVGTVYGISTLLALALKSAFELIGMSVFTALILDVEIRIIAIALCIIFIAINILGVKGAGRIQVLLVFIILAALLLYALRGIKAIDVQNFSTFNPNGWGAVISTAGFVFVSFGGLLKVASLAEEIKDPGRTLPLGMIISLVAVCLIYNAIIFVTVGVLNGAQLSLSMIPISDAAGMILGPWGAILFGLIAILAFTSAANAGIMGASRYPLALSRDGLMPDFLGHINERFKTPHYSILVTGLLMIAALFLELDVIVKAASSVLILTYIFACLAVIILRESHLQNYQPRLRAPFYPWIQLLGIAGFMLLLWRIGHEAILISLILVVSGLFFYWFYGRIRAVREYALLHLIERITAKELTNHLLETELKEIIRERDAIVSDRFDGIIEHCIVMDRSDAIPVEKFFQSVAYAMAGNLDIRPDELFRKLLEREKESSTVISPGIAIPHIVIDGNRHFDILLARCKEGIEFSESAPNVHTIFVLVGTRDERNFHLQSLAAIAQIVQDPDFEKKWMRAKSVEALRDIVLLGKRKRSF